MIKKISIFGDSWSTHSFKKLPNKQESPGTLSFEKLFHEVGITANNYSQYSISNKKIIDILKIHKNNLFDDDLIIIFQTDPLRDVLMPSKQEIKIDEDSLLHFSKNLDEFSENLCNDFYNNIKKIQDEIKKPVLLVGGLGVLHKPAIPKTMLYLDLSWTELAIPSFKDCFYEWVDPTLYIYNHLRSKLNWNSSLTDFFETEKRILEKNSNWQKSDYFGWCHPSDQGYQLMFNTILEKIQND